MSSVRHIIVSASRDCFTNCRGCYNFFGKEKDIVSTDCIVDFLQKVDTNKVKKITLSGGDPLARNDIFSLVERIYNLGFKINLDTVGTPLIKETRTIKSKDNVSMKPLNEIHKYINFLGIALDGSSDEIIKEFRCSNRNLMQEAVDILTECDKYDLNVCINTVVHKQNMNDLLNIMDIVSKFKRVKEWQLFQYMPIGPLGYLNKNKFDISNEDFLKKIKELEGKTDSTSSLHINAKTKEKRKKLYLLIDTDGNAWTPFTAITDGGWENAQQRIIIGNIKEKADIPVILNFIYTGEYK